VRRPLSRPGRVEADLRGAILARQAMGVDAVVLSNEPQVFDTAEQHKIRVSVVARFAIRGR
jgi:phosphohistidine phosphatase SixA